MVNTHKFKKDKPIIFLLILAILISSIHSQCLIDNCKTCPTPTGVLCTECNDGYYLRTFTGGDTEYNACWKTWKLVLAALGALLCYLLCCLCCYLCKKKGLKDRKRMSQSRRMETETYPMNDKITETPKP